jgi:hypothetical protein
MKFITKCALLLMPALALATPAFAYGPAQLSDSEQPGSVIVYPKFINELFGPTGAPLIVDGQTVPQTEIRSARSVRRPSSPPAAPVPSISRSRSAFTGFAPAPRA